MIIAKNKVVKVHYEGFITDTNELFDSSLKIEPLTFIVGHMQMISGFEEELLGSKISEKKKFTLEPERAYGQVDGNMVIERSLSDFPEETEVGVMFQAEINGIPMPFRITNINLESEIVTCDFNHPMAGKTLTFVVEILDIRDATQEEIDHGHIHGDDGLHH